ncbi:MAG: ATP-binding cassette domain-containing protein, partial [Desulfomonile tiedjei]|nr:ATP-binding cassette domain-containing protein [Desulfomonile tiedjei]
FSVDGGGFLGILGGTGSGKTTLIKNLNGLLYPTSGKVLIDRTDTKSFGTGLALKIGVVFQRPERQLFEDTVLNDISFVLRRFSGLSEDEILERARLAARQVGLNLEELGDRSPSSISEGDKRKVAMAGILVNDPEVLVLDEPAVGLDPRSVVDLVEVLHKMKNSKKKTIIVVSHDMGPFLPLLDYMLVLNQGKIAAFGSPDDVCRCLGRDPNMREMLPEIAVLVSDLRSAGCPIPANEFRIPVLAQELSKLAGVAHS